MTSAASQPTLPQGLGVWGRATLSDARRRDTPRTSLSAESRLRRAGLAGTALVRQTGG